MHELAIAESIYDAVVAKATECSATRVKSVRLKIGEATSIELDSLTFCFEMMADLDPLLSRAQLLIDTVPHRARCRYCDKEFAVRNFIAQCPACQEWSDEIVSGTEMQIVEMEIDSAESDHRSEHPGR
ncbi:MAG TPA: hydrogenase maturation nickel metallochaperone HypA [Ktedonobacteraceae bacterium]|jgi:hydrogenase nickel incorporation protein HypA/HybF|nr:hydrogenase maturation nickel metallochaperone HypA [Ktedonobacteraceae bacterium]